ncbi:MAG: MSEP-CTERM sorting domain-containing protein, partial [Kiritimatiellaeota bacterium]|nr:MSEP-CTERM sorting domain-containing protein [Kiritimatiellota bacterium]
VAGAFMGVVFLLGYRVWRELLIPPATPDWMVSPSHTLLVYAGMMPLIVADVWRVATTPLPLPPKRDAIITLASTVGLPIGAFMFLQTLVVVFSASSNFFDSTLATIIGYTFGIMLCAIVPILFFLVFFRALMWIRLWVKSRNARHPGRVWPARLTTVLVAFVLPLAGLLLNRAIPFPADFQNPWVYALTLLNGTVLLMAVIRGQKGHKGHKGQNQDALSAPTATPAPLVPSVPLVPYVPSAPAVPSPFAFFLRWLTFPFTLYFFIIFLPFLPLSILAMIAVGAGFLILAPIFLFWNHVTLLARDWRASTLPRLSKILLALLAVAVIPGVILSNAFLDRVAFRVLLDYTFSPDITQDATLPVSPRRARRVLERAGNFKNANETPILSAIYSQIVFDGLVLSDERFNHMWDCYVGEERPDPDDVSFRNGIGSLFSRNQARARRGRRWRRTSSPQRDAFIEYGETTVVAATNTFEQTVTLRLHIATTNNWAQELHAPVTLPAATWVTGMRLKIDGEWQDASIIERRAAEWVYKQITTAVIPRDPAILTLDTPERGLLRVFPVERELPRELEITFLQPAGLSGEIKIGESEFQFNPGVGSPNLICAGDTIFNPMPYSMLEFHSSWAIIDSSENGLSLGQVQKIFDEFPHYLHSFGFSHILSVNAETKTTVLPKSDGGTPFNARMLLPNQFGLDAVRAVRQVEYHIRDVRSAFQTSTVVFIGDQWENLVPKISFKDYAALRKCTIIKSDGEQIHYQFDHSDWLIPRVYPKNCTPTYPGYLLWTQGAELWKFQQDCYDHGTLNANFKKILSDSSRLGVLVPQTAYIVVETEAQRKMLAVKQLEAANANTALDFDYDTKATTDAPTLLVLVACLAVVFFARKFALKRIKMF